MGLCHAMVDIRTQRRLDPTPTGATAISFSQIRGCWHNDLILAAYSNHGHQWHLSLLSLTPLCLSFLWSGEDIN